MKKKVYSRLDEVVADVPDGARIMFGGFGGAGFPNNLIQALVREGKRCILEMPIHADYAFIKAQKADALGNLTYRLAARNFNPIMAMAARTTIAEVEELVPVGSIEPEHVVTPAIFVHRIVQAK